MFEKIVKAIREVILPLSIITIIIGLLLLCMGILWIGFNDLVVNTPALGFIATVEYYNYYILILGLIVIFFGIWYLYSYLKNKKFVLKTLKTNKRSELLKKHLELEDKVKRLPSKYKRMLDDKKDQLRI